MNYVKTLNEYNDINESTEYVGYVEYKEGKKLIDTFKDIKAAERWNKANVDDLLDDDKIEKVGIMPKSEWDKKEAKYAIKESESVDEKKADGTISDDEDAKRESLLTSVESSIDELIATIKKEANEIGGSFRAPGIEHEAGKVIKAKLQKAKLI